jgi:hypothetical protein
MALHCFTWVHDSAGSVIRDESLEAKRSRKRNGRVPELSKASFAHLVWSEKPQRNYAPVTPSQQQADGDNLGPIRDCYDGALFAPGTRRTREEDRCRVKGPADLRAVPQSGASVSFKFDTGPMAAIWTGRPLCEHVPVEAADRAVAELHMRRFQTSVRTCGHHHK